MIEIRTIESMPFAENSYILWRSGQSDCLLIDPGFEPDLLFEVIEAESLTPVAVWNTHGHADHIAGNEACRERFPDLPIFIGRIDAPMLTDPVLNLSRFFGLDVLSPPANQLLEANESLEALGTIFTVRWIPGHSPGHVVFVYEDQGVTKVLGGDVLFRGGIGRTDFPGGSLPQLLSGIRQHLFQLPDDTIIYPGHGPTTTIGHEKRTNPFTR